MHRRVGVASVLLLVLIHAASAQTIAARSNSQNLLSTRGLAAEVRELGAAWMTGNLSRSQQLKRGRRLRERISHFILRQLEAKPSISARELQDQLRTLFGGESWLKCTDCDDPPHVWATDWGPKTTSRHVVVAYDLSLGFMGPNSELATVESYVWENGAARVTARGGSELDGYISNFARVTAHAHTDGYWIVAWGQVSGASGRGLSGKSLVYRASMDRVEPVWRSSLKLCNIHAQQNSVGWELAYADCDLLYADDPHPYYFDVYSATSGGGGSFRRIVHQRY
jgi:hypothetical protein